MHHLSPPAGDQQQKECLDVLRLFHRYDRVRFGYIPIDVAVFGVSQTSNRMYRACVPTCMTVCVLEAEPPAKTYTTASFAAHGWKGTYMYLPSMLSRGARGVAVWVVLARAQTTHLELMHCISIAPGWDSWFVFRSQMHANSTGNLGFLVVDIYLLPMGLVIR